MPARTVLTRVAVLGCGRGELAIALAHASDGWVVAGFDPDRVAVGVARRAAARSGVSDRVTFEVGDRVRGDRYHVVLARIA